MSIKNRLAQLEKNAPKAGRDGNPYMLMPLEEFERSMNTLAEVLGVTRSELKTELEKLSNEHKTTLAKT